MNSTDVAASPGEQARQLSRQAASGVQIVREVFDWGSIERVPGGYDFTEYDRFMVAAARHRLDVLPVILDAPAFRNGGRANFAPPVRLADIGAFVSALVRRYGPGGAFWRQHRGLPRRPIRGWQIWNEPNLPDFWGGRPDAARYVRMLRLARAAIKRADKRARVVSAGLATAAVGQLASYARRMYAAGARRALDDFGLNAFSQEVSGLTAEVRLIRRLVDARDPGRPIWLTEFGWATGGPDPILRVGNRGQAGRIRVALDSFVRQRRALGVRGIVYYAWRDAATSPGVDNWTFHTGLNDVRFKPKPGFFAFRRTALALLGSRP
jgi:hypothetical protein